ncbi:DUF4145 domain-containing protein [Devosia sp. PTR5]|uniref:DUF4145 domain-containing protein n=2 Tax=Devosia oryzisoli TaxID=2774138 RepID=A0A927ITB7_9HYPH|nr:DUF4145 domain-containing protein [Devosia oryzisoli]
MSRYVDPLRIGKTVHGTVGLWHTAIRCVNDDCNLVTLDVSLNAVSYVGGAGTGYKSTGEIVRVRLAPRSSAKPQPEYIPSPIREDYEEACLILADSPKASATLSRRALQGMLHDFCGIVEKNLFTEITTLEARLKDGTAPKGVEEETIAAIHAIRKIGNIGAHMESDINVIVDVDAGEAQALIDLIEMLFDEWYVARHTRQEKLARILKIDGAKQAARKSRPEMPAALPSPEEQN